MFQLLRHTRFNVLGSLRECVSEWHVARKVDDCRANVPAIWKSKILVTEWDTGLVMFNVIFGHSVTSETRHYNGITFLYVRSVGVDLLFGFTQGEVADLMIVFQPW